MPRRPSPLRLRPARATLAAVLAFAATACAHGAGSRAASEEAQARGAIAAANDEFARALERGDARALAALFAEDGQLIPASQRGFVSGRPEIEAYQARRLQGRRYLEVAITTAELGVSGDLAWETGTSRVKLQQGEGAPVTLTGRYLVVWKRGTDGRWRIRAELPVPDPIGSAP